MNNNFYRHLAEFITNSTPAWIVTITDVDGSSPAAEGMKMLISEDGGEVHGSIGGGDIEYQIIDLVRTEKPLQTKSIEFDLGKLETNDMICGGIAKVMIEPLNQHPVLYIYGAGHCGIALSSLASKCGFRVVIADSRKEWANSNKHPDAERFEIIDYSQAGDIIANQKKAYAVIMTFGHQHDEEVLESLVKMDLHYLGMMGSKSKTKEVFDNLMQKGIKQPQLDKVHAPIGLKIGSRTPWEIAVSIMAEMIKVKCE